MLTTLQRAKRLMLKRFRFLTGIEKRLRKALTPDDVDLLLPEDAFDEVHDTANEHIWRLMVLGARLEFRMFETVDDVEKRDVPWSGESLEGFVGIPPETLRDMATEMDDTFNRFYWQRHSKSSRDAVRSIMDKSLREGWTPQETAKYLQGDPTNTFNRYAAMRIVRTESTGAMNGGQFHARTRLMNDRIIDGEGWLSTLDQDTRDTHAAANQNKVVKREGQWVLVDHAGRIIRRGRNFMLGGHVCRYPGDPSLPAKERIHCRCATFPVVEIDNDMPDPPPPPVQPPKLPKKPPRKPKPKPTPVPKPTTPQKPTSKPVSTRPKTKPKGRSFPAGYEHLNEKGVHAFKESELETLREIVSPQSGPWSTAVKNFAKDKMSKAAISEGYEKVLYVQTRAGGLIEGIAPARISSQKGMIIYDGLMDATDPETMKRMLLGSMERAPFKPSSVGFGRKARGKEAVNKMLGDQLRGLWKDTAVMGRQSALVIHAEDMPKYLAMLEGKAAETTMRIAKRTVAFDTTIEQAQMEANHEITKQRMSVVTERLQREEKRLEAKRQAFLKAAKGGADDVEREIADLTHRRKQLLQQSDAAWDSGDAALGKRLDKEFRELGDRQQQLINQSVKSGKDKRAARLKLYETAGVDDGVKATFDIDDDKIGLGVDAYKVDVQKQRAEEFFERMMDKVHMANPQTVRKGKWIVDTRASSMRSFQTDYGISKDHVAKGVPGKVTSGTASEAPAIVVNPERGTSVWVHEMGHSMEHLGEVHEMTKGFLFKRVGTAKMQRLRDVFPDSNYKLWEVADKDDFGKMWGNPGKYSSSPWYTGKYYHHHTEVLSMGMQKMYEDPVGFAEADPEFFKFILGILDGSLLR